MVFLPVPPDWEEEEAFWASGELLSCYAASALIVILCVAEAMKPETAANGNPGLYYLLAVLGVAFSVFITIRNKGAKKKQTGGPRLKT